MEASGKGAVAAAFAVARAPWEKTMEPVTPKTWNADAGRCGGVVVVPVRHAHFLCCADHHSCPYRPLLFLFVSTSLFLLVVLALEDGGRRLCGASPYSVTATGALRLDWADPTGDPCWHYSDCSRSSSHLWCARWPRAGPRGRSVGPKAGVGWGRQWPMARRRRRRRWWRGAGKEAETKKKQKGGGRRLGWRDASGGGDTTRLPHEDETFSLVCRTEEEEGEGAVLFGVFHCVLHWTFSFRSSRTWGRFLFFWRCRRGREGAFPLLLLFLALFVHLSRPVRHVPLPARLGWPFFPARRVPSRRAGGGGPPWQQAAWQSRPAARNVPVPVAAREERH